MYLQGSSTAQTQELFLKEEIQSLNGVKMQLALKVSLRKGQLDCAEKYIDPVLRHKQEVLFQAREISEALDIAFPSILETLVKLMQRVSRWVVDKVEILWLVTTDWRLLHRLSSNKTKRLSVI